MSQHPFALSEVEVQPQRVAFDFAQAERTLVLVAGPSTSLGTNGMI